MIAELIPEIELSYSGYRICYPNYVLRNGLICGADEMGKSPLFCEPEAAPLIDYWLHDLKYSLDYYIIEITENMVLHSCNFDVRKEATAERDRIRHILVDLLEETAVVVSQQITNTTIQKLKKEKEWEDWRYSVLAFVWQINIPDKAEDMVIRLCRKYGLIIPSDDQYRGSRLCNEEIYKSTEPIHYSFSIIAALGCLTDLYFYFLCWKENLGVLSDLEVDLLKKMYTLLCPDGYKETLHEFCMETIKCISACHYTKMHATYATDGMPMMTVEISHVLDLAFAAMHQIVLMGERALDGKKIKQCKKCGEHFIQYHGAQKYCEKCGTNAERVKDYRRRKKEREQNG